MTYLDLVARAARERASAVVTRADRPAQRRHSDESVGGRALVRAAIELRSSDDAPNLLGFYGQASVYERGYEMWDLFGPYTEIVSAGAAEDLGQADLDVPLVLDHSSMRRIARTTNGTLTLTQDDEALHVDAPTLDRADADVAYIEPKIRSGLIDEMSFRFLITSGQWSPDYTEYRINAFRIHRGDVSIVGYGANPATNIELRGEARRQKPGARVAFTHDDTADRRSSFRAR